MALPRAIFRHFSNKEDLYWAVVASRIKAAGRQEKIHAYLDSGRPEREILAGIAESFLDRNDEDARLTRLLIFSALRNSKLADKFFETYMAGTYKLLADFIRRGVRLGKFRNVDPVIGARAFLGMISSHILLQELFGAGLNGTSPRATGRQLADLWLNGIALSSSKVNGGKSRHKHPGPGNGSPSSAKSRDIGNSESEFIVPQKQLSHTKAERHR
jgi:AcrR family transcriptional regulator